MGDSPSPSPSPPLPRDSSTDSNASASTLTAPSFQQSSENAPHPKRPSTSKSRPASRPSPVVHNSQPQQPIKDAVDTAFHESPTTDQLDPYFMKRLTEQVTEQVIKNLQGASLGGRGPTTSLPLQTGQFPGPPSSTKSTSRSPVQRSPLQSSTDSFPPRFTPPSPHRDRDLRARCESPSPERAPSDAGSSMSRESKTSQKSTQSNRETTPRASQPDGIPIPGLRRAKTTAGGIPEPMTNPDSPPRRRGSGADAASLRKDSKDSTSSHFEATRSRSRPDVVAEEEEAEEATTLEKIWQPLFDNGNPTVRLSQFLRGIAKHIIDDYEPKSSLVITPKKMLRFLDETKVEDENYPWTTIFGGKLSWNSISMMYRKLLCQHHFVQQQMHDPPSIPALTPLGFEAFMTCMIQAHPDTEFDRLARAVRDMPISNADDCKERFPKELSRRLLPASSNMQAEQRIISSLNHEPILVPLERGASAMPPPPPPPSAPPQQSSFPERERAPYCQSMHSNAIDDDDLGVPSMPLERERKPYYAREGSGKRYDPEGEFASRERDAERDSNSAASREPSRPAANKYRPDFTNARSSRQNSGVPPQSMYTDPMNIPPPNTRPRMSTGPPPPPSSGNGSHPKGGRRSPPPRIFARSEPMDLGNIPTSQYASNLHGPPPSRDRFAGDPDEDALRSFNAPRRPSERNMNYMNDEEPSGRPIPSRNGPSGPSGYDSGYGSAGGPPPPPPPAGNFGPPRNAPPPTGSDDRRRSWYPGVGVPGAGTDGYGSYAGSGSGYGTSGY